MNEQWQCPKCKRLTNDSPAISRYDNKTKICSRCGYEEGFFDYNMSLGMSREKAERVAKENAEIMINDPTFKTETEKLSIHDQIIYRKVINEMLEEYKIREEFNKNVVLTEVDGIEYSKLDETLSKVYNNDILKVRAFLIDYNKRIKNMKGIPKLDFIKEALNSHSIQKVKDSQKKWKEDANDEMKEIFKKYDEYLGDGKDHNIHFKMFNIPLNDRLINYQLMVRHLIRAGKMDTEALLVDEFYNDAEIQRINTETFQTFVLPVIKSAKPYRLEEQYVPLIQHIKTKEYNLHMPYDCFVVDMQVDLGTKKYFGFFIANIPEKDNPKVFVPTVITVYSEIHKYDYDIEEESKLFVDIFELEEQKGEMNIDNRNRKDIRLFIKKFLTFINDKEIVFYKCQANPSNNKRRIARKVMPIPNYSEIRVSGTLKIYSDKFQQAIASNRKLPTHRWEVAGHYYYFINKVRFKHIYDISISDLSKFGYEIDPKNNSIRRKWINQYIKGAGPLIIKVHRVVK